jgi:hypothetical protein
MAGLKDKEMGKGSDRETEEKKDIGRETDMR